MKERETEKLALGEEEATRLATRPKERCNMDGCEYQSGEGFCHYYEATGSIRPCVAGELCDFSGKDQKQPAAEYLEYRQHLYDQGMTDRENAEHTGVSISTICEWRRRRGLPPNRGRRKAVKEDAPEPPVEKEEDIPKRQDKKKAEPVQAAGRYFRVLLADGTEIRTREVGIAASAQTVGVLDGDEMVAWFPLGQVRGIYAEAEA